MGPEKETKVEDSLIAFSFTTFRLFACYEYSTSLTLITLII